MIAGQEIVYRPRPQDAPATESPAPKQMDALAHRVGELLDATLAINEEELTEVICEAHRSHAKQKEDPPERFAVPRQALRMFWQFRRHLGAAMCGRREG